MRLQSYNLILDRGEYCLNSASFGQILNVCFLNDLPFNSIYDFLLLRIFHLSHLVEELLIVGPGVVKEGL